MYNKICNVFEPRLREIKLISLILNAQVYFISYRLDLFHPIEARLQLRFKLSKLHRQ